MTVAFGMSKTIAVVIQEDPRKTHRPVEALRIALGLVAGSHKTTVILLNEASRLLSHDIDDVVDVEILEKYLPSVQHLGIPFILHAHVDRSSIVPHFSVTYETDEAIHAFIESVDRTLRF